MTSRVPKLVLAAVLAASIPAAARARDCAHDGREPAHAARPPPVAPPARGWREESWREREVRQVRAELRALDAERAAFHARFAWNPRRLHRYDHAWLERRAVLERRLSELQPPWRHHVAWR